MTGKFVSLFVIAAVIGFLGYMLYEHFKSQSTSKLNAGATVSNPAPADVTAQPVFKTFGPVQPYFF